MPEILLVEDDVRLSEDLQSQLKSEGFNVFPAFDGMIAERLLNRTAFDLVILDINVPLKNGLELCKNFRRANHHTPVIMLTAFAEVDDKLDAFNAGADDYLTKPFYFKELVARIKILLKRAGQLRKDSTPYQLDTLVLLPDKKEVYRDNKPIRLTAREFALLQLLLENKGLPLSKKELMKEVWGSSIQLNTNTVEVFINALRNKIDKDYPVKLIHTRPGFGYYLAVQPTEP
ncbi:MAG: response regulator transcription factor [Bacteroidia bacterium]|jgi:DNA-binding response OmpR family regulator|nr:response regulator transcription factor [Bacteroidia bacterium]MCC6768958.1 response regulator transcription factor [Bacteroidia bacterium]